MSNSEIDREYIAAQLAADGFQHARRYFSNPIAVKQRHHALDVLGALNTSARQRMAEVREMEVEMKVAKMTGKEGPDLNPLWERATARRLPLLPPLADECADGEAEQHAA